MSSAGLPKAGVSPSKLARMTSSISKYIGFTPANSMFVATAFLIASLMFAPADAWESWIIVTALITAPALTATIGVFLIMLGATWRSQDGSE